MSVKATLLQRGTTPEQSFSVSSHDFSNFLKVWHYHAELELVYVIESEGTRFIGDSIDRFRPGELMLIGSNLPHMYQNDDVYFETDSKLRAKAHVIHFHPFFLKTDIGNIPEFRKIHLLIERARLGIKFSQKTSIQLEDKLSRLVSTNGLDSMLYFLEILAFLSKQTDYETIASLGFVNQFKDVGDARLDLVYNYVMNNFQEEISMDHIADLVCMNKASFCRYFKRTTQKTFTEFLNEIRIGFACKMLLEKKMGVLEISYHCGYNNISHFNRQFRKKMGMSPSLYLKSH